MTTLPEKIGKYEIQGILGRGGMGVVYKGYYRAIARGVAIKAITKASLDSEELKHVVARFRHEAQAVGRLVHPRIVQIYDYGEDDEVAGRGEDPGTDRRPLARVRPAQDPQARWRPVRPRRRLREVGVAAAGAAVPPWAARRPYQGWPGRSGPCHHCADWH